MFKNYLKIAFRNIAKQKSYAAINLCGLATGIACSILIILYVLDESSYDRYHVNADRIVRLSTGIAKGDGSFQDYAGAAAMWAPALKQEYPEVENFVRFYRYRSEVLVTDLSREKQFYEGNFYFADSTVLDVFTYPLLSGDAHTALDAPGKVIISESMARKYFGLPNPLGLKIIYINRETIFELEITGVMRDVPPNSHFRPDFLASLSTFKPGTWHWSYDIPTSWDNPFYRTYLVLNEKGDTDRLGPELNAFLTRHMGDAAQEFRPFLQPLTAIHLHSNIAGELEANSDIKYIYIFLSVAIMIMLVGCINYMNLATARSISRAREVGLRKALGCHRNQLIWQFYGESFLMTAIAVMLAFALVESALPWFNSFTGRQIWIDYLSRNWLLSVLLLLLVVSLLTGSYPALFMSAFSPIRILKGQFRAGSAGQTRIRRGLVIFQFGLTAFLLFATYVISKQLDFFRGERLGFSKQVVTLPLRGNDVDRNFMTFKNEILSQAGVLGASASSHVPFTKNKTGDFKLPEILGSEPIFTSEYFVVDETFPSLFDLEFVAGRNFLPGEDQNPQTQKSFILNESAVRALGIDSDTAIGKRIDHEFWETSGTIVGVVKDFHYKSLHSAIGPLVIKNDPKYVRFLAVKIAGDNSSGTLRALYRTWRAIFPATPFVFNFLDDEIDRLYDNEASISLLFRIFSLVAIFISCLGLFGLAAFAAEQRTKEVGVRKVLGASVARVVMLLSVDFTRLVLIGFVVAAPLAYLAMERWLEAFAYRITLDALPFLVTLTVVLTLAWLTVGYQALKAAALNPVESLRHE